MEPLNTSILARQGLGPGVLPKMFVHVVQGDTLDCTFITTVNKPPLESLSLYIYIGYHCSRPPPQKNAYPTSTFKREKPTHGTAKYIYIG